MCTGRNACVWKMRRGRPFYERMHAAATIPLQQNGTGWPVGRTPYDQNICYGCGGIGYEWQFCPGNKQSGTAQNQWNGNSGFQMIGLVCAGGRQQNEAWPVLKMNTERMVIQGVLCRRKRISAEIDTGAVVSVFSLAKELK